MTALIIDDAEAVALARDLVNSWTLSRAQIAFVIELARKGGGIDSMYNALTLAHDTPWPCFREVSAIVRVINWCDRRQATPTEPRG